VTNFNKSYEDIISPENLLLAWQEFVNGKRKKKDVQEFSLNLADNIFQLHSDLKNLSYKHGKYHAFNISDPKPRNIHKASVRDRLLHHAIYRILYPYFDKKFIHDSYSCRINKGTHKALNKYRTYSRKASKNNSRQAFVLKCDIRKFFASIDQNILQFILEKHIEDKETLWLLRQIIESFHSTEIGKGLPLGNLTSQLLVNIYMNEFDQFMKHRLKVKYYIRYADDFVILSAYGAADRQNTRIGLEKLLSQIDSFLKTHLKLTLHPDKVFIKTLSSGVDFLGWVHFPTHRVIRTTTKRRMIKRIEENPEDSTVASYLGMLSHGNSYKIRSDVEEKALLNTA
jgi:RNA-directed DNA polymerase